MAGLRDRARSIATRCVARALSGSWPQDARDADGNPIHDQLAPRGLEALYRRAGVVASIARHFNRAYYYSTETTVYGASWLGVRAVKYPTDMWVYQELLHRQRPDLVIETGTYLGGSALYLASLCELLGSGRVISVDVALGDYGPLPEHERISYLRGSSIDAGIVAQIAAAAAGGRVMVILDSAHTFEHVLAELRAYGPLVYAGGYLIVEDTNVNGHPVLPGWGPGPMEAVDAYLAEQPGFEIASECEKFLLTSNPRGYLKRLAP